MVGVNLHEGIMEVAFEQWMERAAGDNLQTSVEFNVFSTLQGSGIGTEFLY